MTFYNTFGFLLFFSLIVTTVVLVKAGNTNSDRNALLAFRRGVLDQNNVLESWNSNFDTCIWSHVVCDDDNRVIRIDLGGGDLLGNVTSELGNLDRLNYLELYKNNLGGPIPPELGNLVNLKGFDLYNNQFSGTIPQSLGKLSQLSFIRLNNNHLTGSIPDELGNIPTLEIVDVSNNHLCGSVPRGGSLSKIKTYDYGNNPNIDKPC